MATPEKLPGTSSENSNSPSPFEAVQRRLKSEVDPPEWAYSS